MTNHFSLEQWQAISLLVTMIGAFWGLARMLLLAAKRDIESKFGRIAEHMQRQDDAGRQLERQLLELKADLARDYVRREDYTRAVATIETKIDALALRAEQLFRDLLVRVGGNA